jgi:hypothetical protein
LKAVQRHAQDVAVLLCSRFLDQKILRTRHNWPQVVRHAIHLVCRLWQCGHESLATAHRSSVGHHDACVGRCQPLLLATRFGSSNCAWPLSAPGVLLVPTPTRLQVHHLLRATVGSGSEEAGSEALCATMVWNGGGKSCNKSGSSDGSKGWSSDGLRLAMWAEQSISVEDDIPFRRTVVPPAESNEVRCPHNRGSE